MTGLRRLGAATAALLALTVAPTPVAATAARAPLPADRLHFGLSSEPGQLDWMTSSGVPWRYRFSYLAGGVNTGSGWTTWNSPAGQYATYYMDASTSAPASYIPVFTYYMLLQSNPSSGSDELTRDYNNLNNPATMAAYYADFKLLMQKAGAYGKTVVIHVEPDLWGYMQQKAAGGDSSTVSAAVASSGFAEAAGQPNTVQGFAHELLQLRDTYAPNASMGIHASPWASSIDIASDADPMLNVRTEADKTAAFLNSTGTWDYVFNDVDDHTAAWWEQQGVNRWWDPQNVQFPNFTRYLSWVSELHARTAKPQIVWQVPMGNQYFLTLNNTCGHYQDNIAPYFIAHPGDLYAAGLIAVIFGPGNGCQTNYDDSQGDGVTNNGGVPTSDAAGGCIACNTHPSIYPDDDGGYLRIFVGQYYQSSTPGGYNILTAAGAIYSFGSATYHGNLLDHGYPGPAVGLAETPDGGGYDILTTFGGIYTFGNAAYFGNLIDHGYPGPAVALSMTPSGHGYAIVTSAGGFYTFGDGRYFGNLIDHGYPGPAVSFAYTPSGNGYAILTAAGAVYTFGDAQYYGNLLDHGYPGPAVSLAYTPSGRGYTILTASGAIYTFGDALYRGNLLDHGYPGPAVALATTP
ncbi:MAG TPA: hypothetical protein VF160_03295 [Candidatus Dormibacteraeota bacterium]